MKIGLSYTIQPVAIKMYEIKWFQETFSKIYPISRFAIVSSDSFNNTLIDGINTTETCTNSFCSLLFQKFCIKSFSCLLKII